MVQLRGVVIGLAVLAMLGGCAKPPKNGPTTSRSAYTQEMPAKADEKEQVARALLTGNSDPKVDPVRTASIAPHLELRRSGQALEGRTLSVSMQKDIQLAKGEFVLTFDDGPRPGKTEKILDILDEHDVKAMFLMLGRSAQSHPGLVREVAKRGHTVGLHTHSHGDLTKLNVAAALAEIERGQRPVVAALSPIHKAPAPFFRFPYLAQNAQLRTAVTNSGYVIMDVGVDSKDYFSDSADQVRERTLARMAKAGRGIVLFHDIHHRTVKMLPQLLKDMEARGYKVVNLVPQDQPRFKSVVQLANK
ncbi:polysaccharide deacetylase [Maritalea mobilis]|uniref:Chitooligosaccharide deacetylase n=1 Tax=Maritalea mobilis TaxID=483324 RepID=A0A4R6VU74_9HYPH|nr:polysaccharide deacetylase family protein [Maritalea mobilis]TDQ67021.1 polysaccharide deacetylase [Maritalea mobilis]